MYIQNFNPKNFIKNGKFMTTDAEGKCKMCTLVNMLVIHFINTF